MDIKTLNDSLTPLLGIKAGQIWSDQIIERLRLNPKDKYSYCPYCAQRAKRGNPENWKDDLKPMWKLTHYVVITMGDNKGRGLIEKKFFCDVCKKEITEDDYLACRPVQQFIKKEFDLTKIPRGAPVIW